MRLHTLLRTALHKTIVAKTHSDTWKGKLEDYDNKLLLLSNVYALDNIIGATPADGHILLPRNDIEYIQTLTENE